MISTLSDTNIPVRQRIYKAGMNVARDLWCSLLASHLNPLVASYQHPYPDFLLNQLNWNLYRGGQAIRKNRKINKTIRPSRSCSPNTGLTHRIGLELKYHIFAAEECRVRIWEEIALSRGQMTGVIVTCQQVNCLCGFKKDILLLCASMFSYVQRRN